MEIFRLQARSSVAGCGRSEERSELQSRLSEWRVKPAEMGPVACVKHIPGQSPNTMVPLLSAISLEGMTSLAHANTD